VVFWTHPSRVFLSTVRGKKVTTRYAVDEPFEATRVETDRKKETFPLFGRWLSIL